MTDAELLELVQRMRAAQRRYFETRDRGDLNKSKDLERQVDKALAARFSAQGALL